MSFWPFNLVTRGELNTALTKLKGEVMANEQADVDAVTAQVNKVSTDLETVSTTLQNEINNLASANPGVDLSGLQAAVAPLDDAVNALGQIQPQAPPPATP